MKKVASKFLICLILPLFFSCQTSSQIRVDRDLEGFSAIEVSSGVDLFLTQSDRESVEIEASESVLEDLEVIVENKTLIIRRDGNIFGIMGSGPIKAYVSFKDLGLISVSGGADLIGQGSMKFDKLSMQASGGADIKMDLSARELEVFSSGGSDVKLSGSASVFKGQASGGSDIEARDLETEEAQVSASGGSDAEIRVLNTLSASASGGSDIYYYGNPPNVDASESGGSDVTRKDM